MTAAIQKRYGTSVKRDDPARDACQKTALTLAAVQDRIRKKQLKFAPKGVAMADLRGLR